MASNVEVVRNCPALVGKTMAPGRRRTRWRSGHSDRAISGLDLVVLIDGSIRQSMPAKILRIF